MIKIFGNYARSLVAKQPKNLLASNSQFFKATRLFSYNLEDEFKGTVLLREENSGYYLNPEDVSRRMLRIFAAHDNVENPENITLATTFYELRARGMDDLSKVEIFLGVEREFDIQMPDDTVERFLNVREAVEYVSKSFHAH